MPTHSSEPELAVEMRGIVKRFADVVANDRVDLDVRAGEVHALLGENGAGKTTLMNILFGIYHPDAGEIRVRGVPTAIRSPKDAIHLGIGMIHQHFRLVASHTVAENIVLGLPGSLLFPDRRIHGQVAAIAHKYGMRADPEARIWQLSAGEQQRVEILKALFRGARILILDEPTSMLTPGETKELLASLRRMAGEGHTIIFISHKLDEVLAVSDRVTVMRYGQKVATLDTAQTDERELARLMVGREVLFRLQKKPAQVGEVVLCLKDLHALNDKGFPALKGVSLDVHGGEIVGIAGVAGNGQRELVETLVGLREAAGGRIFLGGRELTRSSPRERTDLGLACVPGERLTALIPSLSVAQNLILKCYRRPPVARGPFLDRAAVASFADQLIDEYDIMTPSRQIPLRLLSGGNIQRVLLAREISCRPSLLITAHPTSGLDVGATETIWQLLLEQRQRGVAVLLVSEDLEEILTLSDRIAVIFEGVIMGVLASAQADLEQIGLMMAGAARQPVGQAA